MTGLCASQPVFIHSKLKKADYYGNCICGENGEVINGVCGCPAGLILDDSGRICYNGIDSTFDQTQEGFLSIKIGTLLVIKKYRINDRESYEIIII